MFDVGYKNYIDKDRILAVMPPNSSKAKRIIKEAQISRRLINCTNGRKTGSILLLKTSHLILSPLKCSVLNKRLEEVNNKQEDQNS
jgi:extracellular matrix regulatory protein A